MVKIEAFRAFHYNPQVVSDISKVICPPYDVIDAKEQEACYQRSPYNVIRLILGKELSGDSEQKNKYSRAAGYIEDWVGRGVWVQDKTPAVYFYEQVFEVDGEKKSRLGFLALMRLDDDDSQRSVHPHEHTHTAPKEDRLRLLKCVETNLSPIFTIFSDASGVVKKIFGDCRAVSDPFFDVCDTAGVGHRFWRLENSGQIKKIKDFLSEQDVFIADGHHRYEVARMFRAWKRDQDPGNFKESCNYIMTFFTPLEDKGLCILPTHRLVKDLVFDVGLLEDLFSVKPVSGAAELEKEMAASAESAGVFGLYKEKKFYLFKLKDLKSCERILKDSPKEYRDLDVVILHKMLLEPVLKVELPQISYEVKLDKAIAAVDQGLAGALFVLNPTKVEQIRSIALCGEVMPQKSTYFYPKLSSGFLVHKF